MNKWRRSGLLLILLFSVAAFLRIALAVKPGLWADEIFSLAIATGHSLEHPAAVADPAHGDYAEPREPQVPSAFHPYMRHEMPPAGMARVLRAVLLSDTNPPLYYFLLNLWTRAAGTSDAALRLFSTVWALSCLPLLWAVGQRAGGRRVAWTACVLFAFAPRALFYSAEGRMYSLVWFFGLALVWSTFELARRRPQPHLVLLWSVSGAAGLLTHYFFAFLWLACLIWLWLHPGGTSRAYVTAATVIAVFLVAPWYFHLTTSLDAWRITGDWLAQPLSWRQLLLAPARLGGSLLAGRGIWGGPIWPDLFAAGAYVLLGVFISQRPLWPLLTYRRQLLWLWVLSSVLGPVAFDVLTHSSASLILRYALPGLPAALLLAALGMSRLPCTGHLAFLLLLLLAWTPAIGDIFENPSRPWEPYPSVAARLDALTVPSDLVIIHSIPSGVLGVARYMSTDTPVVSWVVQLGLRSLPADMEHLVVGRCRVALVKIHYLNEPSPAEAWLREHGELDHQDKFDGLTEILYFVLEPPAGKSTKTCPAWSRSTPNAQGTNRRLVRHTAD